MAITSLLLAIHSIVRIKYNQVELTEKDCYSKLYKNKKEA